MPVTTPRRPGSRTDQHWVVGSSGSKKLGARTQPGFLPPQGTTATMTTPMTVTATVPTQSFSSVVGKTMPLGLQLSDGEREVLNALGRVPSLTVREIGEIAKVNDPLGWMEQFLRKLASIGLDVVTPGDDRGGEPTYVLRR